MADWANSSNMIIRPYRSYRGSPAIRHYQPSTCVSSRLIKVGEIVQFDTNVGSNAHRIVSAQSTAGAAANLLQVDASHILGIAVEADASDGSTLGLATRAKVGVALADHHTEFIGWIRYASGNTIASTMIGTTKGIIRDSTAGIWQIESTGSTAAHHSIVITEVPDEHVGDTGGKLVFRFLSTLYNPING